nr:MAG TPA: delta-sleep-inducing peptide [Caudoviricetes sp.]
MPSSGLLEKNSLIKCKASISPSVRSRFSVANAGTHEAIRQQRTSRTETNFFIVIPLSCLGGVNVYQRKRQLKQRIEDLQAKVEMLERENFALRKETYMSEGLLKSNPLLSWYGKELCLAFGRILVAPRYMHLDFDQYSKYMRNVLDYLKEIRLLEESYQRENQADGGDADGKQEAQAT